MFKLFFENFYNFDDLNENISDKEYLQKVCDELNKNCKYCKVNPESFTLSDLDFDIDKCRSYCQVRSLVNGDKEWELCDSCRDILIDKILKPFNRTSLQMHKELNSINSRLATLEKSLLQILSKLNI